MMCCVCEFEDNVLNFVIDFLVCLKGVCSRICGEVVEICLKELEGLEIEVSLLFGDFCLRF